MSPAARSPEIKALLRDLNPAQRQAVTHGAGPLLIIAGAGTGKTRVIAHRIAYLIAAKKARADEILAVTFTEKAANEMEERVDVLVPYTYSFAQISTFNSFGERVLRDHALEIGFAPDFRLLDEVEQAILFRENLFRFTLDHYRPLGYPTRHIQELLEAIKRLKQEDVKPEDYAAYAARLQAEARDEAGRETARKHAEVARVYGEYQELLRRHGMIDFEDQVNLVVDLFRRRPSILQAFQARTKYILVDEFQDTNFVQFELLKMLAAGHRNLTVVGDDDQSIFRFRGASLSNILNFRSVYRGAREVVLVRNYRTVQPILDAAYQLIQHNNPDRLEFRSRVNKRLTSVVKEPGKHIHMFQFDTLSHEADRVADLILEKQRDGLAWCDLAVLVRRNADADAFLRAFQSRGIPYRFSGSRGLYQRDEIKLLVAFIRAVTDFDDSRSLFYLALSDVYRIPAYDLTRLSNHAQLKNLSLHAALKAVFEGRSPVELDEAGAAAARRLYEDLLAYVALAGTRNAGQVVYAFLERSGTLKGLVERPSDESELRIKNIRLFFDKIRNFTGLAEDDSLASFARYLELLQQVGDNPATAEAELDEDAVNVLTVHKAKGLEFRAVFMAGLIEDRFPGHERRERIPVPDALLKESLPEDRAERNIQEERRLFYVGMTRAKSVLTLTWARDYGVKRLKKVSPFVLEALDLPRIPDEVLKTSALEEIRRFAREEERVRAAGRPRRTGLLTLSYVQVEDYLVCPLKYKFRHLLRIPVLPHHTLVFGRVLHAAVHADLCARQKGRPLTEEELIRRYEELWTNEGFLSREHEELRKKEGERALRRFHAREAASGRTPAFLEKNFKWQAGRVRFVGRFDRIDLTPEGAVIIDYKASEAASEKEADRLTAASLQMDIYALSYLRTEGVPPAETRLDFLGSGIDGRAAKGEREFARAEERIRTAEEGIRAGATEAKPEWESCRTCEFKAICPSSYAY